MCVCICVSRHDKDVFRSSLGSYWAINSKIERAIQLLFGNMEANSFALKNKNKNNIYIYIYIYIYNVSVPNPNQYASDHNSLCNASNRVCLFVLTHFLGTEKVSFSEVSYLY